MALPPQVITLIQQAVTAKSADAFQILVPTIIDKLSNTERADWSENDVQLMQSFFDKFNHFCLSSNANFTQDAMRFAKLSHQNQLEFIKNFDLSKLESQHMAEVINNKVNAETTNSMWSTLLGAAVAVVGIFGAVSTIQQHQQNSYNLKRPRSLSEKIFGDK